MSNDHGDSDKLPAPVAAPTEVQRADEPPVVARLIVEIRSDGSRTIARGSLEDATEGVRIGVQASGSTPLDVAASLARSIFELPALVRSRGRLAPRLLHGARALLPGGRRKPGK